MNEFVRIQKVADAQEDSVFLWGARQVGKSTLIKKLYPDSVGIFLLPPSMDVLENRLRSRGTEDEEDVKKLKKLSNVQMIFYQQ